MKTGKEEGKIGSTSQPGLWKENNGDENGGNEVKEYRTVSHIDMLNQRADAYTDKGGVLGISLNFNERL